MVKVLMGYLKRRVFRRHLKVSEVGESLMLKGSPFQTVRAKYLNDLLPNSVENRDNPTVLMPSKAASTNNHEYSVSITEESVSVTRITSTINTVSAKSNYLKRSLLTFNVSLTLNTASLIWICISKCPLQHNDDLK